MFLAISTKEMFGGIQWAVFMFEMEGLTWTKYNKMAHKQSEDSFFGR